MNSQFDNSDFIDDILRYNNTAQEQLEGILENTNKNINELNINQSLEGDLDFSILTSSNFGLVESINIQSGSVTSIRHLPKKLKSLSIQRNLISMLPELPSYLENLVINNNNIKVVNLDGLKHLQNINLDYNGIEVIEKFPITLTELSVSHNKINQLNLKQLDKLVYLNISENPIHVIENFPENVAEYIYENTPSIEMRNTFTDVEDLYTQKEIEEIKKEKEMKANYKESLHRYFKLKDEYEQQLYKSKKKIYKKDISKKKKRKDLKSVVAPCVKCKRDVGTLFFKKDNTYIAICGSSQEPCNLNIKLHDGGTFLLSDSLKDTYDNLSEIKENIIKHKLDTLFNYVDEETAADLYKTLLEDFNLTNTFYQKYLKQTEEIFNSKVRSNTIKEKTENLNVKLQSMEQMLKSYNENHNEELIKESIELYKSEIVPEIRNIQQLKYEVLEMSIDKNNISTVFQYPVSLDKLEDNFENQRVEKFIV